MRNVIDFSVERDEVSLFCEIADASCMESCINFITSAASLVVRLQQGSTTTETTFSNVSGSACYMLPDAAIRAAGEFTVCANGCTPLRFIVEAAIPAGTEYFISMHANGAFYVRAASAGSGNDDFGMFAFEIDESGHLICIYSGNNPPPLSIDENGHLICTLEG